MTLAGRLDLGLWMQLRPVRAGKKKKFTQVETFGISSRLPAVDSLMPVKIPAAMLAPGRALHLTSFLSGAEGSVRTGGYAVYRRGFEKDPALPIGDEIVYVENGLRITFEVPDVKCPGADIGLRQAAGMLVMPISKLHAHSTHSGDRVSVRQDFNPQTDVRVVDIMRPRGWALVDENGYPQRTEPLGGEGRYCCAMNSQVRHSGEFEDGSTGWHGSLALEGYDYFPIPESSASSVLCRGDTVCTHSSYKCPADIEGNRLVGPFNLIANHRWSELAEVAVLGPTWLLRTLISFGVAMEKAYGSSNQAGPGSW